MSKSQVKVTHVLYFYLGNLTYEEAVESEKKAKKRLGDIPKPLKKALLWLADHTSRGRVNDVVDDVYAYANARYFLGEIVEGIIDEQWCDCKVVKVIPPTQEEIDKDAEEEAKEEENKKEDSPTKKGKNKKTFSPPEHLFKYELLEVEPDDPENNPVSNCFYIETIYIRIYVDLNFPQF